MKKGLAAFFIFTGLFCSFALQARADATVYWDYDNGFSPGTVVIGPGETVTWWNIDWYGFDMNVTFDNGYSFFLPNYYGQRVSFPLQTGTYGYHSDWGDNGAVIVNLPPSVAITNPPNNAVFPAPATFTVRATASDTADDYVSDVQFFLGTSASTNSIADVFAAPYTAPVTNLGVGTYTLIVVATDSRGAQATNSTTITVSGVSVNLTAPRISAGQFLFDVMGLAVGKTNVLQTSTNLLSWKPTQTNIAVSTSMTVTNGPASGPHFYRILQMP